MRAWHFSENAYPFLPPQDQYESIRVNLPNRNYDPAKGAALYDRFSSRGEADFADKLLSAMRYQFGGHLEKAPAPKGAGS